MKIDTVSPAQHSPLLPDDLSPGIFPYLGGNVGVDRLRSVIRACGGAVVSGARGARTAAGLVGVLIDPATYVQQQKADYSEGLFEFDDWLMRQQGAGVPVLLTDTPRIRNKDRSALLDALTRWAGVGQPSVVVLPVESWWLRDGLKWLIEDVRAAGRPVAIVLMDPFNGLNRAGSVSGLLTLIAEVAPLPVIMLRCDISAVGAVAHGAFAGYVGWSSSSRHGPLPIRSNNEAERDDSPSVLVPALHEYLKASRLPALTRSRQRGVFRCDCPFCRGESLLQIAVQAETDIRAARALAGQHNLASTEQIARRVLSALWPRDAWWQTCASGAQTIVSLMESGIDLELKSWLRQWLDVGSPSHDFQGVG